MSSSDYQLVRYKVEKMQFEVAVKPNSIQQFRNKKKSMDDTLFSSDIYRDFSKGDLCSDDDLQKFFSTTDKNAALEKILNDGDYQLSTQERRDMTDKRRREIIAYIHKYFIDPKTQKPHPMTRIENALTKMKYTVDYRKPAENQVRDILSKMREQIPLKKSTIEASLSLSHQNMGKCSGIIQKYCTVAREKYTGQGVEYEIQVIPGDLDTFLKLLNDQTKGDYDLKIAGANADASAEAETPSKGRGKGKKKKKK